MFYSSFENGKYKGETVKNPPLAVLNQNTGKEKLSASIVSGPQENWCGKSNRGSKGENCLLVEGLHKNSGRYSANAVIFEGLDIKINENTKLSYVIFPDYENEYDYELTGQFLALDLVFSDGTYMSDYKPLDQNGHLVTPLAQGRTRSLYTRQWNNIVADLGKAAAGKTIVSIIAKYDKSQNRSNGVLKIKAYFDDIKIYDKEPTIRESPADYILTTRGTNDSLTFSRGLSFPAATVPNGFNFYSPSTTAGGRSIYDYDDTKITHFIVSHQASYHLCDFGCFMFMPNTLVKTATEDNCCASQRAAEFYHEDETAKAHCYSVKFDEISAAGGVTAEIAPEDHSVIARFKFPETAENVNVILDCVCEYTTDKSKLCFNGDGSFFAESEYRFAPQDPGFVKMYYYGVFNIKPEFSCVLCENRSFGIAQFKKGTTVVELRLASSYISYEQAKKNLSFEISEKDTFEAISNSARQKWNKYLNLFEIEGATEQQLITFYSNLYRMYSYPTNLSENIGTPENPEIAYASPYGITDGVQVVKKGQIYGSNGFWDTYRTNWAAYALFTPSEDTRLLNGIIQHYRDCGWVGRWLYPGAINCMVGTNSDVIFADAYIKGIKFDYEPAFYSALKNAAVYSPDTTFGRLKSYTTPFMPHTPGDVCWSLENAIDDYGVMQFAKALNMKDEYEYYRNSAKKYKNVFSSEADFFVAKDENGEFITDVTNLDPYFWGYSYCETNAWGTTFTVNHDVLGISSLYGGRKALREKIDEFFTAKTSYTANHFQHEMYEAREIRLGQYQHSNQPAHHNIFMYNYTDTPYKTQALVRDILDRLFVGSEFGQGYVGDDDNGEQSAWYNLNALGFYPMNMGSGQYLIGSPLFKEVTIHRETGDLTIIANNNSRENVYIKNMTVDGIPYNNVFISHKDLINAKIIVFDMTDVPSEFGKDGILPASLTGENEKVELLNDATEKIKTLTSDSSFNSCENSAYVSGISKEEAENLFDNSSLTSANFSKKEAVINFMFPEGKTVEILTVTSSENPEKAPSGIKLYASESGAENSYTLLDERREEKWQWANYVRPFAFKNSVAYKYYKLILSGSENISISEIELLSK